MEEESSSNGDKNHKNFNAVAGNQSMKSSVD